MKIIQEKNSCNVKEYKRKDAHIAFGFYRTKEQMFNPYPSRHCQFYTDVFGKSSLAPGHLKNTGGVT